MTTGRINQVTISFDARRKVDKTPLLPSNTHHVLGLLQPTEVKEGFFQDEAFITGHFNLCTHKR